LEPPEDNVRLWAVVLAMLRKYVFIIGTAEIAWR